jgi:hypothetical protein
MDTLFWSSKVALLVFPMFNRRLLEVFDDSVLYTPSKEVQLGTGRRETLKLDALCTAKRIKQLLTVAVQTRLVCDMDREHLASWCGVRHVIVLGVVGHEPFEFAKGYVLAVPQNIVKLFTILWYIKKFREAGQKQFRLAH